MMAKMDGFVRQREIRILNTNRFCGRLETEILPRHSEFLVQTSTVVNNYFLNVQNLVVRIVHSS